jgi:hypothetical protein
MMDTTSLRDAYRTLLDAAATVADVADPPPTPSTGGWNAAQILAHVSLVNATTIAAVACVASGANTTYDNRTALDTWTIDHVIALAGSEEALRERIRIQGQALCVLVGPTLSEAELDSRYPRCCCPTASSSSTSRCRCGTSSQASPRWSCLVTRNSSWPCGRCEVRKNGRVPGSDDPSGCAP